MLRALMTAASGMKAQQMQVDTIANNIANVNTAGYKKSTLAFRSLLYQTIREPGAPTSATQVDATGLQVGSGTEIAASKKLFMQGELQPTGAPLDLAVRGEGFFKVDAPSGEPRYTRAGSFRIDGEGTIVTTEGYRLTGAPTIDPAATGIQIGEDGSLFVMLGEDQLPTQVGTIQITRFPNPGGLKAQGNNYFSETASSGAPSDQTPTQNGAGSLLQGYLERSNVSTVDELVGLIVAQRNYEVNSRAIKVSDEMLQQVNQLIR